MDNVQAWVQIGTWCVSLSTSMLYNQCDCKQKPLFFHFALGSMLGQVGPGWACLRPIAYLGPYVGPMFMLAYVGPILAYVGPVLALCWPYVGLCWPHVGPSCGPCWGYVGDMWDHLYWKTSKMPIFPFRTPPRNQKPRKNCGFLLLRTKKMCSSKRAKHRKTRCFCDLTHRKYRKLRWLWSLIVRGWVGGRGGGACIRPGPAGPMLAVSLPCSSSLLSEGERGRHPAADQAYRVLRWFLLFLILSHFSDLVAQDGSTWAIIGFNIGQHSLKMGQHSPQDGPT